LAGRHVSSLDDHLGYWLRFVSSHVAHAFALKLQAHNVTVAEWVMLRQLFDCEAVTPSELAGRLGMTRGGVSKLADRLASKSLIERSTGLADRRFQSLALTAKGRALVPVLAALADANDSEFFGHLEPFERRRIETAMQQIVARYAFKVAPLE